MSDRPPLAGGARATLRLGTRRSPLALHQANLVRDAVLTADPQLEVELVELVSDGDRDERQLTQIAERGIFAARLERALSDGEIDAAVHSSKDLPLEPHATLVLAAWPDRADPRDALVGSALPFGELPAGATLATGSARRMASLRTIRADFEPRPVRGNVRTRIERARERGDAGCVLAMAGLTRLGITADPDVTVQPFDVDELVPEAGQGAIVVQARTHVCDTTGFVWSRIDDVDVRRTVSLERELARLLGGGCSRPVGVHVELSAGRIRAFASTSPDLPGQRAVLDIVGLELAPLLSVSDATDIDDAAVWVAAKLAVQVGAALGLQPAEVQAP